MDWVNWAKKAALIVGPIAAAAALAYAVAGGQSARGQQGIEDYQNEFDATNPIPVKVLSDSSSGGGFSRIFDRLLTIDDVRQVEERNESGTVSATLWRPYPAGAAPYTAESTVAFSLVGNNYAPIVINDIRVKVLDRRAPVSGTVYFASPQGGTNVETLNFDLDAADTSARATPRYANDREEKYFLKRKLILNKDEPVPVVINVRTASCDCDYVLEALLGDGRTIVLDNNGRPWRATAFAPQYGAAYAYNINASGTPSEIVPCVWPVECQRY